MQTHRVIYRLDYPFNDKMCDQPGKVIRTIMDGGGERYSEVQDSPLKRMASVEGTTNEGGRRWKLQVAPLYIVLSMEWGEGLVLNELLSVPEFKDALDVIDQLKRVFDVDQIDRAGLRSFLFENIQDVNTLKVFTKQFDEGLITKVKGSLGDINDIALVCEGEGGDSTIYRLSLGPYFEREYSKYLELVSPTEGFESYNVICDCDLSQKNFRSRGHTSSAWIKTLLPRMKKFERDIGETLRRPE